MTTKPSGWVVLAGHIISSGDDRWHTDYSWDRRYYPTKPAEQQSRMFVQPQEVSVS